MAVSHRGGGSSGGEVVEAFPESPWSLVQEESLEPLVLISM